MISSPIRLFAVVGALVGLGLIISQYDPSHTELIENGQVLSATASAQLHQDGHPQSSPKSGNLFQQTGQLFYQGVDTIQTYLNPF